MKIHVQFWDSPVLKQYAVVFTVNLSVMVCGLNLGWMSPVLVKLQDRNQTILSHSLTDDQGSWLVSIGLLMALLGIFLTDFLLDRIGRKFCIIFTFLPRIVYHLLIFFGSEFWMILLGRALQGFADAIVFLVVSIYATEIASSEIRGSLGTILQIFSCLGIVTMLSVGPFISYFTINLIITVFTIATFIPLWALPDSPYFLYAKGRTDECMKVLTFLRGSETTAREEIKEYSINSTGTEVSTKDILKKKTFWKALLIVAILAFANHLTGGNVVTYYLQTILVSTNTSMPSEIASVVIGCLQLGASMVTPFVSDSFGRKPILIASALGTAIGMTGLGTFFWMRTEAPHLITGAVNYMPLISLALVVFCFSTGIASIYWVLAAELFDGPSRSLGCGLGLKITYIAAFLVTKFFPLVAASLGPAATYWSFSVISLIVCIYVVFCVPETKGRTISEIQKVLGG